MWSDNVQRFNKIMLLTKHFLLLTVVDQQHSFMSSQHMRITMTVVHL